MKLSIVLPTYNRLDQLKQVLAGLEVQTFPLDQFEVVVVSDGSPDDTDAYLRQVATPLQLNPVFQVNQGVAVARNRGIREARADVILFIDDDVVPTPTLLEQHLNTHSAENIVVLGPMLSPPDFVMKPWVDWEQKMLMKQYEDMLEGKWQPTARQFYTGNTSVRREHLIAAGGFDPAFRRAEDVELAYRLDGMGLEFVFNYDAVGYHYAERSFQSWLAIPYAYGRNDVIFCQEKGQSWLLPTIWREYQGRHQLIRLLTQLCLDREMPSKVALNVMRGFAALGHKTNIMALPRIAYSGIFNLRHYQGVADQLGGREQFFAGVDSHSDKDSQKDIVHPRGVMSL
ncbi:MAG TPA: glycosyltransferase family 2 protein [Anaerolineae bacterium]|nr:glycosyltransferase family 2 protein [Anaerolineae bacterium]